ncbi:MAG: hypothetical protein ACQERV_04735 [Bacteroidota bacterium]
MKKLTIAGLVLAIMITGCKTRTSESEEEQEIQKLLDRQAQMQEIQEERVDELDQIQDSLASEKETLIRQRELKDEQITLLEQNRQALAEKLKEEQVSAVASEKTELENKISAYEDSIRQLKDEMAGLGTRLDSIEQSIDFYEMQEGRTEASLESGISEIDQRIRQREDRKQQELKQANLLQRRIRIADEKIEAYQMEKQMYVEERDDLLRTNASEEELEPYRERIARVDSIIDEEMQNKQALQSELREVREWIAENDSVVEDLKARIRLEYDKKDIIANFIESEKERLQRELENIKSARQDLVEEQNQISEELAGTGEQIESLNREMELIRNREMSEILEQQATIEQAEARLAEEEIRLLEEGATGILEEEAVSDSVSDELRTLLTMSSELDSLNELIQDEKAAIARTRKQLAERRAEIADQRARFGRTLWIVIVVIVVGAAGLLALFYYLGRRSRKSS